MAGSSSPPRPKPFRVNAQTRGARRTAFGMIGLSLLLYGSVVAMSYLGQDYARTHGGEGDDFHQSGGVSGSQAGGVGGAQDSDHDHGDGNGEGDGGGGGGAEGDGGVGVAGVGGGGGAGGGGDGGDSVNHRTRASEDAWKAAAAEVHKARAVNRLLGMDKVDHYLTKRREQKSATTTAGSGGGGGHGGHGGHGGGSGGHKARDTWVAVSRSATDKDHTDTKFYDQYLKKMLEKKPPYPLLKALLNAGKDVKGVEISDVRKTSCAGMSSAGRVVQATLDSIPYPDGAFDVVFSSEVLEHVPPSLAAASVNELVRVAAKDVFVTISLRRSGLDPRRGPTKVHLTVRTRAWWETLFVQAGCEVNRGNLRAMEEYDEARYGTRPNFFSFTCSKGGGGGQGGRVGGDGDGGGGRDGDGGVRDELTGSGGSGGSGVSEHPHGASEAHDTHHGTA